MPYTLQVLAGLIAGLVIGIGSSLVDWPWARALPSVVEPVGTLFINAIRMTVIPLVCAGLVVGVSATRDARAIGRVGVRALVVFVIGIALAAVFSAAIGYPLFASLTIDPGVAASLRASAKSSTLGAGAASVPTFVEWLVGLIPANPFKAASDGAMLPLIMFAVAFGLTLNYVKPSARDVMVGALEAVFDGMLVLVGWILRAAPLGVFALAMPLGARMGTGAAGALLYYVVVMCGVCTAFTVLVLCPAAVVMGRQSPRTFLRAIAPAVAVAFTSRSSLAALPASIEAVRSDLRLPEEITAVYLPLAASMFRVGGAIAQVLGVLFVARLYGISLAPSQLGTMIVIAVLTTFTIPGIPAGAIIVIAPVLASVGVPAEGLGLLIGVDSIPDMFRTAANVIGWLTGAVILAARGASASSQGVGIGGPDPESRSRP